jgi:hypothetical protein
MREIGTCVIPIVFLVAIFGTVVLLRWFKHREILTLAEKGLLPVQYAQYMSASRGRGLLGWGIALVALPSALSRGLGGMLRGRRIPYTSALGCWAA